MLTSEVALADYFESVVGAGVEPKTAANWVMGDVMTSYNETRHLSRRAATAGRPVALVRDGVVSHQAAKRVYAELAQRRPTSPRPWPSGSVWCR